MPIQGFVRSRAHQFGRQAVFGTNVAAKRRYPFKGVPSVDLNWTDPDVDVGALTIVAPPVRGAGNITASLTDPSLAYNNLPLPHSAIFGGGVTPTGVTAKTWVFNPNAVTPAAFDTHTYQFGDDVITDWYQLGDGVLDSWEVNGPEGLGVLSSSMAWRFGNARSTGSTDSPVTGTVPTTGLSVSTSDVLVYLKDGSISLGSTFAGITQVSNALHNFNLRVTAENDAKRFANATQSFNVSEYGRAGFAVELDCTFAKTAATVGTGSESDAWMDDTAVNRYVQMTFTSTSNADTGIPYSWVFSMPMRWYARVEGESNGNTIITLTGRAFYDSGTYAGVFKSTAINTLASASL